MGLSNIVSSREYELNSDDPETDGSHASWLSSNGVGDRSCGREAINHNNSCAKSGLRLRWNSPVMSNAQIDVNYCPEIPQNVDNPRVKFSTPRQAMSGHANAQTSQSGGHVTPTRQRSDWSQVLGDNHSQNENFTHGTCGNTMFNSDVNNSDVNMGSRNRKQKEPDKFDGKTVDWVDYVSHFETVSRWNGWGQYEMASQLTMCLRGAAQQLLGDLSADQLTSYDRLKSVLTQRFAPAERVTAYRCEFRARKRERTESVTDYGYSLRRLAARAFPKTTWEAREDIVVDQYINGLGTLELKRHVQFAHPSTLGSAISAAVEFEAFDVTQQNVRKPQTVSVSSESVCMVQASTIPAKQEHSENKQDIKALRLEVEQNAQLLRQLNDTISELSSEHPVPVSNREPFRGNNSRGPTDYQSYGHSGGWNRTQSGGITLDPLGNTVWHKQGPAECKQGEITPGVP
jgi:hypothetical protein